MSDDKTTIQISQELLDELWKRKSDRKQTYEDVIRELIDNEEES
jgi:predicted CopG family antitoxin